MLNTQDQRMSCPLPGCKGQIVFNTYKLLEGAKFVCPSCKSEIGISSQSKDKVENTMTKFEQMRQQMMKKKRNPTNL